MCQNSADRNPKWIRRLPSQPEPRGSAEYSSHAHARSGGWDGSIASAWRAGFACRDFPARRNEFPVPDHRESVAMTAERLGNLGAGSARRVQFRRSSPSCAKSRPTQNASNSRILEAGTRASGFEPEGRGFAKRPSAAQRKPAKLARESLPACQPFRIVVPSRSVTDHSVGLSRSFEPRRGPAAPDRGGGAHYASASSARCAGSNTNPS